MPDPLTLKVWTIVSVEYPCPRCDGVFRQAREAPLLPDGRVDMSRDFGPPNEGPTPDEPMVCLNCNKREYSKQRRASYRRKKFLAGEARLVK
jgi:hypothetical protein